MVVLRGMILAAMLGSMACRRAPLVTCTPPQFGLAESFKGRATLERAIAKADVVLGGLSGFAFTPGWQARASKTRTLPVYIVDGSGVAATESAFAAGNSDCV